MILIIFLIIFIFQTANEIRPNGDEIPSPPILLASLGDDPNKSTLCIYGHLDVQPAAVEDGWNTDPFVLVEVSFILSKFHFEF